MKKTNRTVQLVLTATACLALSACNKRNGLEQNQSPAPQPAVKKEKPMEVGYVPSNPDSQAQTNQNLVVELSSADEFKSDQPVQIQFKVSNKGSQNERVCTVFTPLEKLKRYHLTVFKADGSQVQPRTSLKAGPKPMAGDHLELLPGQSHSVKVDLHQDYDLSPGKYSVLFRGHDYVNHLPDSRPLEIVVE